MLQKYVQSLKAVEAEEVFDLVLYRPLAFPLVLALVPTPVTPNQVTLLSFLVTLAAALLYGMAAPRALLAAGIVYFVSRVLDCVDGQLARAGKGGSKLGKLYDGLADYFGHAAVFVGLGFALGHGALGRGLALPAAPGLVLPAWLWALLAGLSLVYLSILADKYKNEYLTRRFGDRKTPEEELREMREELGRARGLERLLLRVFTAYLALQSRMGRGSRGGEESPAARELYCRRNRAPLFAWNLVGPSMQASLLVLFSVIDRLDLFVLSVVLFLNLATVPLHLWQAAVNRSVRRDAASA